MASGDDPSRPPRVPGPPRNRFEYPDDENENRATQQANGGSMNEVRTLPYSDPVQRRNRSGSRLTETVTSGDLENSSTQQNQDNHRDLGLDDAFWRNSMSPVWGPPGNAQGWGPPGNPRIRRLEIQGSDVPVTRDGRSGCRQISETVSSQRSTQDERSRSRHRSETLTSQRSTQDQNRRTNSVGFQGISMNNTVNEGVGSIRVSETKKRESSYPDRGRMRNESNLSRSWETHTQNINPQRESFSVDRGIANYGASRPRNRTSSQSTNDGSRMDNRRSIVFEDELAELNDFRNDTLQRQDMNSGRMTDEREANSHRRNIIRHTQNNNSPFLEYEANSHRRNIIHHTQNNNSPFVVRKDFRSGFPDPMDSFYDGPNNQESTEEAYFKKIREDQGPKRRANVIPSIKVPRKSDKNDPFMWVVVKESFINDSDKVEMYYRRKPRVVKIRKLLNPVEANNQLHITFNVGNSVKFFIEHVSGRDIFLDNEKVIKQKCEENSMFYNNITIQDVQESSIFTGKVVDGYTHKEHLLIKRVDASEDEPPDDNSGRLHRGKSKVLNYSSEEDNVGPKMQKNSSDDDSYGGRLDFVSSSHGDVKQEDLSSDDDRSGRSSHLDFGSSDRLNLRPGGSRGTYEERAQSSSHEVKVENAEDNLEDKHEVKEEEDEAPPFRFNSSTPIAAANKSHESLPDVDKLPTNGPQDEYEKVKVNGSRGPDGHQCSVDHIIKEILPSFSGGSMVIEIDRRNILESVLQEYQKMEQENKLKETFQIAFKGERAIDAGGPSREFIRLLIKEAQDKNILGGDSETGLTFQPRFNLAKTIEAVVFFLFNPRIITAIEPTFPPVLLAILFERNVPVSPDVWHRFFKEYPSNGGTDLDINLNMLNTMGVSEMKENHPYIFASLLYECQLAIGNSPLTPENKIETIGRMFEYQMTFKNTGLWALVREGIKKSGFKELTNSHPAAPAIYSFELVPFLTNTSQDVLSKIEYRNLSAADSEDGKRAKEQLQKTLQHLENGVVFFNQVSEVRLDLKDFCIHVTGGTNLMCVDQIDIKFTRVEGSFFQAVTCSYQLTLPLGVKDDKVFEDLLYEKMSFSGFTSY